MQSTAKIRDKKRAARAAQLFFLFEPVIFLFCGVVVAVAIVISQLPVVSVATVTTVYNPRYIFYMESEKNVFQT